AAGSGRPRTGARGLPPVDADMAAALKGPARFCEKMPKQKGRPFRNRPSSPVLDGLHLVGTIGFEPTTPTMSRWCSNQLSYVPAMAAHFTEASRGVKRFYPKLLK